MRPILDEQGRVGWERVVARFLADDGYPSKCSQPWPLRLLLSQWRRYDAPEVRSSPCDGEASDAERETAELVRAEYATRRTSDYPWERRDWEHLRACLAHAGGDASLVVATFALGLENASGGKYPGASNLAELRRNWAPLQSASSRGDGGEQRRREAVGGDIPRTAIARIYEES